MFSDQLQIALVEMADPAKDREYRQKAEEFYDKLHSWLKRQDSMKKYRLTKYQSRSAPMDVFSYEIPSKAIGLGEAYPKFSVILAPFRTGTARFGKRGKDRAIVMPVLTKDALEGEHPEMMAVSLNYVREVFIHEFIHYLDDLRYQGQKVVTASAALEKKGGKAAYFNSPVEFNAYFQGGASEVEKYAARLPPGMFSRQFGRSFRKFRKSYEHLFNKTFRRMLQDKWKKKYEVRLWQLWQDMLARDREAV